MCISYYHEIHEKIYGRDAKLNPFEENLRFTWEAALAERWEPNLELDPSGISNDFVGSPLCSATVLFSLSTSGFSSPHKPNIDFIWFKV